MSTSVKYTKEDDMLTITTYVIGVECDTINMSTDEFRDLCQQVDYAIDCEEEFRDLCHQVDYAIDCEEDPHE